MISLAEIQLIELHSKRIKLRQVEKSDGEAIYAIYSDYESSLLDDWIPLKSIEEANKKTIAIVNANNSRSQITYSIEKIDEKKVIGLCGIFSINEESSNCCIFYQINKNYRNQGFATEAVSIMTKFCFDYLKLHRLVAYITPGNEASIKVLANCGYKIEGILRDMEFYKGKYWDGIVMAIIEKEK